MYGNTTTQHSQLSQQNLFLSTVRLLNFHNHVHLSISRCFLALLIVAAILWKIKQRYDRYRRRQRLFVEMEQMASRPFGSVLVELDRLPESSPGGGGSSSSNAPVVVGSSNSGGEDSAVVSTGVRKRKRKYRPSPIALEPCDGNRAAVLSLIVRLPTGGKPYAPPGYTGIAVASSLVTLGTHEPICISGKMSFFVLPQVTLESQALTSTPAKTWTIPRPAVRGARDRMLSRPTSRKQFLFTLSLSLVLRNNTKRFMLT